MSLSRLLEGCELQPTAASCSECKYNILADVVPGPSDSLPRRTLGPLYSGPSYGLVHTGARTTAVARVGVDKSRESIGANTSSSLPKFTRVETLNANFIKVQSMTDIPQEISELLQWMQEVTDEWNCSSISRCSSRLLPRIYQGGSCFIKRPI